MSTIVKGAKAFIFNEFRINHVTINTVSRKILI